MDIDDLLDELQSSPPKKVAAKPTPSDDWDWANSDDPPKAQNQKPPQKKYQAQTFDEYDDNEWHDEEPKPSKK